MKQVVLIKILVSFSKSPLAQTTIQIIRDNPRDRRISSLPIVMPPKAKAAKQDKSKGDKTKTEKSKASSDDPKKLKAANAIKVRHILCEKQSKSNNLRVLVLNLVLEAIAKLKEVPV